MPAEVAGMTDDTETTEPLGSGINDGRKSALRAPASRGVEARARAARRRSWPDEDKPRMVRETLEPGAVVQAVADRNGGSTGQLYTWRKAMLAAASGFVPVAVTPGVPRVEAPTRGGAGGGGRDARGDRDRAAVRRHGARQRPRRCGGAARRAGRAGRALMFGPPPGTRVYLACGTTDS